MPRFAKANQTIEDLKKKIKDMDDLYHIVYSNAYKKIDDDLSKVDVEFENVDYINEFETPGTEPLESFEMIGGIPIAWCAGGGGWQLPLVFCLYISDKGDLRGYIPSKGNAYDHKNKQAYCEDDFDEREYELLYAFNAIELREDVGNRIKIKGSPLYTPLYTEEFRLYTPGSLSC